MTLKGLPRTTEGLQAAYDELKADGLIAPKAAPEPVRGRASGLSTRSSAVPPPPAAKDPRKMTTQELLEAAGGYINPRF